MDSRAWPNSGRTRLDHAPGPGVVADVAEQVAVVRIDQLLADVYEVETSALGRRAEPQAVDLAVLGTDHVVVAEADHVRLIAERALVDQRGPADESHQQVVGDGSHRVGQRRRPHLRREPRGAGATDRDARLAVDVHQVQHVARIDEVRIGDVWVDVPDLRPVPGVAQEHAGDVPQRVALLDHVLTGGVRRERHGHGAARHLGERRCRGHRPERDTGTGHGQAEACGPDPGAPAGRTVECGAQVAIHPFLHRVSGS